MGLAFSNRLDKAPRQIRLCERCPPISACGSRMSTRAIARRILEQPALWRTRHFPECFWKASRATGGRARFPNFEIPIRHNPLLWPHRSEMHLHFRPRRQCALPDTGEPARRQQGCDPPRCQMLPRREPPTGRDQSPLQERQCRPVRPFLHSMAEIASPGERATGFQGERSRKLHRRRHMRRQVYDQPRHTACGTISVPQHRQD